MMMVYQHEVTLLMTLAKSCRKRRSLTAVWWKLKYLKQNDTFIWNLASVIQIDATLCVKLIVISRFLWGSLFMTFSGHTCYYDNNTTCTGWAKKVSLRSLHITSSNTGRFLKFFHCHILQEMKWSLDIPPRLKSVATLSCEIFMSEN